MGPGVSFGSLASAEKNTRLPCKCTDRKIVHASLGVTSSWIATEAHQYASVANDQQKVGLKDA